MWHPIRNRRRRRAVEALHNMPPGYGERYHYHSVFDDFDGQVLRGDFDPTPPQILRLEPLDEPTNVIEAFRQFTACRVCGFKARVCSSAACPQREG